MAEQEIAVDLEVALAPYAERTLERQARRRLERLVAADAPDEAVLARMHQAVREGFDALPGGGW